MRYSPESDLGRDGRSAPATSSLIRSASRLIHASVMLDGTERDDDASAERVGVCRARGSTLAPSGARGASRSRLSYGKPVTGSLCHEVTHERDA